jgi:hypothetical protein
VVSSKTILVVTIILVSVVTSFTFRDVFYIRDLASGDLLWNKDTAYFFLHAGSLGYQLSYLRYFGDLITGLFGAVPLPTDQTSSVLVLEIEQDRVQRFQTSSLSLDVFTPIDQDIYSASGGIVFKWSGTHFEHASDQEVQRFRANKNYAPDFTNVDGWSKRCCVLERAEKSTFDIQLRDGPATLVVKRDGIWSISVELARKAGSAERIWSLDERSGKVSRASYKQVFANP